MKAKARGAGTVLILAHAPFVALGSLNGSVRIVIVGEGGWVRWFRIHSGIILPVDAGTVRRALTVTQTVGFIAVDEDTVKSRRRISCEVRNHSRVEVAKSQHDR